MKNWERMLVALASALLTLSLTSCGGGGSSSGANNGSGGQSSTIVVSSASLAMRQIEGTTHLATLITELLIRSAEADVYNVTISGGEFGAGKMYTTNDAGLVYIPVFGGAYTICIEGGACFENIVLGTDSVMLFNAESGIYDTYNADDEEVVGEFAVQGQEYKRIACHKGRKSIRIAKQAVYNAHIAHYDTPGMCNGDGNGQQYPDNGGNGQPKVTICHNPDKNPKTIRVSGSALDAHLGHGDTEGACT